MRIYDTQVITLVTLNLVLLKKLDASVNISMESIEQWG